MNKNTNKYYMFFKRLANPLRINIIDSLKEKPRSVSQLCKELKVEQSKLSHALILLKHCNIVESKIKGKQRIYSLNKKTILPMLKLLDKHEKKYCKVCMAMRGRK